MFKTNLSGGIKFGATVHDRLP